MILTRTGPLGTSAPELLVSLQAALQGSPDLAIGNVIGSNIANLALVLGITAIILPIPVSRNTLRVDWPVMVGATFLLWFMMRDLILSTWEGVILVLSLIVYLAYLFIQSKRNPVSVEQDVDLVDEQSSGMVKNVLFVIGGCLSLVLGADLLVKGAVLTPSRFLLARY